MFVIATGVTPKNFSRIEQELFELTLWHPGGIGDFRKKNA